MFMPLLGVCLLALSHALPPALTYQTFRSPPVTLRSGQIANTPSPKYPLEFPPGQIAVRYLAARVVDEQGQNVSMSELYVHHWLIYNGGVNGGMCAGLPNIWGIGAELNRVIYEYPYPAAYVTTGKEAWQVNLHFIRTSNVPPALVQDCIECRCADSNPPLHPHGDVGCCADGGMCWGMENSTIDDAKAYYLEYTVGYNQVSGSDVALTTISLDATATNTVDCLIQYDVPSLGDGRNHTISSLSVVPQDWNVTYAQLHLHVGGLVMTMEHMRGGQKIGDLCTGTAVYVEAGPDKGHVLDIPYCVFQPPGYQLKKGDALRLTSTYGPRTLPEGSPWHAGVMSLSFLAVSAARDPVLDCLASLHYYCGPPIYPSGAQCLACAQLHRQALADANCTQQLVQSECAKNNDHGNIPAPDEVSGMSLHVVPAARPGYYTQTLTCPQGTWCAIGFNLVDTIMDNSTSFVYSADPAAPSGMSLHARTLGNHNPGVDLGPYQHTETTKNGVVTIVFDVPSPVSSPNLDRICFLFARGASGVTTLGYHGSLRGFSCLRLM